MNRRSSRGKQNDPFSEHLIEIMLVASGLDWDLNRAVPIGKGADTVYKLVVSDSHDTQRQAVLKAPQATSTKQFIHEPKLIQYVDENTSIPVPTVYAMHLSPHDLPEPYYVMEYVGNSSIGQYSNIEDQHYFNNKHLLAQISADAGRHLALIHKCGPLTTFGRVGIVDGELEVIAHDTDSWSDWLKSTVDSSRAPLNELGDIGENVQQYIYESVAGIQKIEPVPIHYDYRPQNLVLDRENGVDTVLDWGAVQSAHSVYELILTEQYLSNWGPLDAEVRSVVREHLYDAYTKHHPTAQDTILQYRKLYLTVTRLSALSKIMSLSGQGRSLQMSNHKAFFQQLLQQ